MPPRIVTGLSNWFIAMVVLVEMEPVTPGRPWNGLGTSVFQSSVSSGRPAAVEHLCAPRYLLLQIEARQILIQALRMLSVLLCV